MKEEPRERIAELAAVLSEGAKLLWEISGSMERNGPPSLRIQLTLALKRGYELRDWAIRAHAEWQVQRDAYQRGRDLADAMRDVAEQSFRDKQSRQQP